MSTSVGEVSTEAISPSTRRWRLLHMRGNSGVWSISGRKCVVKKGTTIGDGIGTLVFLVGVGGLA